MPVVALAKEFISVAELLGALDRENALVTVLLSRWDYDKYGFAGR